MKGNEKTDENGEVLSGICVDRFHFRKESYYARRLFDFFADILKKETDCELWAKPSRDLNGHLSVSAYGLMLAMAYLCRWTALSGKNREVGLTASAGDTKIFFQISTPPATVPGFIDEIIHRIGEAAFFQYERFESQDEIIFQFKMDRFHSMTFTSYSDPNPSKIFQVVAFAVSTAEQDFRRKNAGTSDDSLPVRK